ncbi:MAG: hypothetical protein LBH82_00900, partial [Bacteroidales bacterium]|nr:hypothetical protein [Bacteroidales bacterium]
ILFKECKGTTFLLTFFRFVVFFISPSFSAQNPYSTLMFDSSDEGKLTEFYSVKILIIHFFKHKTDKACTKRKTFRYKTKPIPQFI